MIVLKKGLLGVLFLLLLVGVVVLFKVGITYNKGASSLKDNASLKHDIVMEIDETIKELDLLEVKKDTGRYMEGTFVNGTGYTIPKLTIVYEIRDEKGLILKESKLELGEVKKGSSVLLSIPVDGMFNYTIAMTSSSNLGF